MATYTFDVTLSANDRYLINRQEIPPLDLQSGNTYIFNVQTPGHPFYIKIDRVLGDGSAYTFQVTNNGADQGEVKIVLPKGPVPKLFYQDSVLLANGASLTNVQHIDRSIKHALGDQLPGFVSAEYPMFQRFMEAYYEWLSQPGNTDFNVQKLLESQDVDTSVDLFLEHLENEFLTQIPKDIEVDKRTLIKNIRSFYSSKGTEKSYEFLFNILFNEQVEFYYPKNDILRASDGKWSTVTSVRLLNDNNYDVFQLTGKTIQQDYTYVDPNTNIPETRIWATAKVDRIIQFYLGDNLITEAYLSNLVNPLGDFQYSTSDDEADRQYVYYIDDANNPIEFRIIPMLTTITVDNAGTGYSAGTLLQVDTAPNDSGVGAIAQIASIYQGSVSGINIISNGQGYQVNDLVQFEGNAEVGGSGAFAFVSDVSTSGMKYVKATTQDIDYSGRGIGGSPIHFEKLQDIYNDTPVERVMYFSVHGPGNVNFDGDLTNISELDFGGTVKWDYFRVYIEDTIEDAEASTTPVIDLVDQPFIDESEAIVDDKIVRVEFSYSITGATYTVSDGETAEMSAIMDMTFLADGSIREIKLVSSGSGYRKVPVVQVVSTTGTGASIRASGESIGKIKEVKVLNQNFGALYYEAPSIDMSAYGGGDAIVTLGIGSIARHPGTFRNDDGHLSEAKYLQDNKYYQTFSYVLRTGLSIENYRDTIKKLVHPAGMELFGEVFITNNAPVAMFNNFQNDPNDLIVSQRLGGLQIPKYKKTIMHFKTIWTDTVTYGTDDMQDLQGNYLLYRRPRVLGTNVEVYDDPTLWYTPGKVIIVKNMNVGVDPTDLQVFSFPTLSFPIQREIENIIIDNQIEVTKNIHLHLRNEENVEVFVHTNKKVMTQEQVDLGVTQLGSWFHHEIMLNADSTIDSTDSRYRRTIIIPGRDLFALTDDLSLEPNPFDTISAVVEARLSVQVFDIIKQMDVSAEISSMYEREMHSYENDMKIKSFDSRGSRIILVGVGEIRDWVYPGQTIQDVQDEWSTIKRWARDLSLHVRIDSQLIGQDKRTEIIQIILDTQNVEVNTFQTRIPEINLETQTLMGMSSTYIKHINELTDEAIDVRANWKTPHTFTGADHEFFLNRNTLVNPTIELNLDLTIGVQREIHRHWTTHNYLLTSPREVEVIAKPVEVKTNELTITIGLKEIRDYENVLIGSLDGNSAIRALDPTSLIVIPYDIIYRNIPVEKVVKQLSVESTLIGVSPVTDTQRFEIISLRQLDMKATVTSQRTRFTRNANAYDVKMGAGDPQNITNNKNLFNGFIYKIEENTISSFDPDNTSIRSIANSQLVSTSQTIFIRDVNDNILQTL